MSARVVDMFQDSAHAGYAQHSEQADGENHGASLELKAARKMGKRRYRELILLYLLAACIIAVVRVAFPRTVPDETSRASFYTLAAILVAAWILFVPPIPAATQTDDEEDDYADTRALDCACGIPNSNDVLSNVALTVAGAQGLWLLRPTFLGGHVSMSDAEHFSWNVANCWILLSGPASAWYHLKPVHRRLAADRGPIACGANSFVVALVAAREQPQLWVCAACMFVCNAFGAYAVYRFLVYRECRLYYFSQYGVLALGIGAILLFPLQPCTWGAPAGIATYILAKILEDLDFEVFSWTGSRVSGHTIKHVVAAAAAGLVNTALATNGRV